MPHDYLNISDSLYYPGFLVIETSFFEKYRAYGKGLTNKRVKNVEIPSTFEEKTIAEVGCASFGFKMLGERAFRDCTSLKEVRFEKGSELEKIEYSAFLKCTSLTKIDIPETPMRRDFR